jgi:hypothetical protein
MVADGLAEALLKQLGKMGKSAGNLSAGLQTLADVI